MEKERALSHEKVAIETPTPDDFAAYLPWVCTQLQVEQKVVVKKVYKEEYVSSHLTERRKTRGHKSMGILASVTQIASAFHKEDRSRSKVFESDESSSSNSDIRVTAVYTGDHLVQIKFDKNKYMPSIVLKIIGLILQFHVNMQSIVFNKGLDQLCVYEISKLISTFYITEVCLDGTFLYESNYSILFEKENNLKYLSLCRCSIDDKIIETIASKLIFPMSASQTLAILNLASNRISDEGAIHIAKALRSNRKLCYLNLSSNMITDIGADAILSTLLEFPLTKEEIIDSKSRLIKYLNYKNDIITKLLVEFKTENEKVKKIKTKPGTAAGKKVKTLEKEHSGISGQGFLKDATYSDVMLYKKAECSAEDYIGSFQDPFSPDNTIIKDGKLHSLGNNILCYINFAYNNLSYILLKKLLSVLNYQINNDRIPRGLMNIRIEGNPLPIECENMAKIDNCLRSRLSCLDRKSIMSRRRPISK